MNASADAFEALYDVGEELGRGRFAVVRACTERLSGLRFAAKFIRKRAFSTSCHGARRSDIEREVAILSEVGCHEHVIALHAVFETASDVILVLELVLGGELFHYVCERKRLFEHEASEFIRQILLGLKHMHSMCVAHLDLKPENIMLQSKTSAKIKLIDFGLSRKISPGMRVKDMMGTVEFVAPEIVNYDSLSVATDMWAVGVITYILLSGASPFLGETRDETFCNISAVSYAFDSKYFSGVSELAKDFIRHLFVRNPRHRATAEESLHHPWIERENTKGQAAIAAINVQLVKSYNTRRRWKHSVRVIIVCFRILAKTRLRRLLNSGNSLDIDQLVSSSGDIRDSKQLITEALFCACAEGFATSLEELLSLANIDINCVNANGYRPVHAAAATGQVEVIKYLEFKGAKMNSKDMRGDQALHVATRNGHLQAVEYLMIVEVDVNQENSCGETALHVAARCGHTEIVRQLLTSSTIDCNVRDRYGDTPLHVSCLRGFAAIVDLLCQHGAEVDTQNNVGQSALHFAATSGCVECACRLLDSGCQVESADKDGRTALHFALQHRQVEVSLFLVKQISNLNSQDKNGFSLLHVAANEGVLPVLQVLCKSGASVNILNQDCMTALHLASAAGHDEAVRVLCLNGCDIGIKNKDGLTAENLAQSHHHAEIVDILKKLKSHQLRDAFIQQMLPTANHIRRVKVKVFGSCGAGKTKLLEALRSNMIGNFFRRMSCSSPREEMNPLDRFAGSSEVSWHANYTKGIEVYDGTVQGCGEFSFWEYSGVSSFFCVYDHFAGNVNCIHLIVFRVTDSMEVQYQTILFWLNFLKNCTPPLEPIGTSGVASVRARVVIVGTHADLADPQGVKNPDGVWNCTEADAVLSTIKHRFSIDFDIYDSLILVDVAQPNCPGMKLLKTYLAKCRQEILQELPKTSGFLEASVSYLSTLRKSMSACPVVPWPLLVTLLRKDINPFASECKCRHLIEQLQLSGEVLYLKYSKISDLVVLSPNWFSSYVLGKILSPEVVRNHSANGLLTETDIIHMFREVPDISLLISLLDAVNLCTPVEGRSRSDYEFPALNFLPMPAGGPWHSGGRNFVFGAVRLLPSWGGDSMIRCVFYRVQLNLRRSVTEFQDLADADLSQWHGCSRLISGCVEGVLSIFGADRGIEVKVRGPAELSKSCFYFFEDLLSIVEQTVTEMAPGLTLQRYFLSPKDLSQGSCCPAVFTPDRMIEMQLNERLNVRSTEDGDESFVDVVCFGCTEIAIALTLCVDLPITCITMNARRELAALLDPQDSMGRDWRIVAVKLGLASQLPDVDCSGPRVSKTDQVLGEWAAQNLSKATIGALLRCLREIGRQDAIDVLCRSVPLYTFSTTNDDGQTFNDSGVASSNSRSNYGTPQRSESTLSNN